MFQKIEKQGFSIIFLLLLVSAFSFIGYNAYLLFSNSGQATQQNTASLPLTALLLKPVDCQECFSLEEAASRLLQGGFETVSFETGTGKELVEKYSISKLPALIVFDQSKILGSQASQLFASKKDALILESPAPPFFDVSNKQVKGKVNGVAISPVNCATCTKASDLVQELKTIGVYIESTNLQEGTSGAGEFIKKYNLTFLPAFIFSPDLLEYDQFKEAWQVLGSIEKDGFLVMRQTLPPFKNISTGVIEGLVSVTYLEDASCAQCYNVSIHKNILKNFNVFVANEEFVDVASLEGQAIVEKYNVSKVPTMLLSREASAYFPLEKAWLTAGSIEEDETHVFRQLNSIPGIVYRDLISNSIVTVPGSS